MAILKTATLAAMFGIALIAGVAACSDDDNNNPPPGGTDAGADGATPNGDAGPCDFNTFVTNLITNNTNATALPSTDLGDGCTDTQTPFPASTFQ